jgi:hypothetical protein
MNKKTETAMNTIKLKNNGHSARQRTIDKIKQKVLFVFILVVSLVITSCNEQSKSQDLADSKKKQTTVTKDTVNKPNVNIKVNKRYDDKGNLIGFDSTYSSYYSNVQGDTAKMDSLFDNFDTYFNKNHSLFFRDRLDRLFFNDSLRYPDFFHDDYFLKRYELNDDYFKDMMKKMDSIKNRFYLEQNKRQKKPSESKI